jgi:hypothetical protein
MKIPSSINLFGLKIHTLYDNKLMQNKGFIGEAQYNTCTIALDKTMTVSRFVEQSYIHELVHWVFFVLGEHKLRKNEVMVDLIAHLLYQAIETSVFEEIKCLENSSNSGEESPLEVGTSIASDKT